MRRSLWLMPVALVALAAPTPAHADTVPLPLFQPIEESPAPSPPSATLSLNGPLVVQPFGPDVPARLVLFQSIRITRPTDIPPPKPAKGVGIVFDW